jgi:hypothetical protein
MRYLDLLLKSSETPREFKSLAATAVPVIADNVTRYFFEENDQEYWEMQNDFPNLSPPFELFWIETAPPRRIHSRQFGDRSSSLDGLSWWGALFEAIETDQLDSSKFVDAVTLQFGKSLGKELDQATEIAAQLLRSKGWREGLGHEESKQIAAGLNSQETQFIHNVLTGWRVRSGDLDLNKLPGIERAISHMRQARWNVRATLFMHVSGAAKPYFPVAVTVLLVNQDGTLLPMSPKRPPDCGPHMIGLVEPYASEPFERQQESRALFAVMMDPLWLAISFMHRRGVTLLDQPISERESRRLEGKNGNPLVQFKKLGIDAHVFSEMTEWLLERPSRVN